MNRESQKRALFDAVTNMDEDLIDEASAPKSLAFPKYIRRIGICAAALLLLLVASLFLNGGNHASPMFAIYVYANETDTVELRMDGERSIYSNVMNSTLPGGPMFDPTLFPNETEPMFCFDISLEAYTGSYVKHEVYCNGERIVFYNDDGALEHTTKEIIAAQPLLAPGESKRLSVWGRVERTSILEVILYDKDDVFLQKNSMMIVPTKDGYYMMLLDVDVAKTK